MPRRLSGSIREINGTFEASVPERRGPKQRIYEYFDTRDDAERWSAAAVDALYAERPVPLGAAYKCPPIGAVDATAGDPTERHPAVVLITPARLGQEGRSPPGGPPVPASRGRNRSG